MRDILIMAYEYKLDSILEGFEGPKYISKLDELDLEYILNSPRSIEYKLNRIALTPKIIKTMHKQVSELARF